MNGPLLQCGIATRKLAGQSECGDLHAIRILPGGQLVAAIDGLGHGEEAANASRIAARVLVTADDPRPVELFRQCHDALRGSRGAVMSLALFDRSDGTMAWLGVGNVEGRLWSCGSAAASRGKSLMLRAGILGHNLPNLAVSVFPVGPGDEIVLCTDGISPDFTRPSGTDDSPQGTAERVMAEYSRDNDDALVVVARYLGLPAGTPVAGSGRIVSGPDGLSI